MKKSMLMIVLVYTMVKSTIMHAHLPAAAAAGAGAGAASKQSEAKKIEEQPLNQLKVWYHSNFTQLKQQLDLLSYIKGLLRFNHLKIAKAHLKEAHINFTELDTEIIKQNDTLAKQATEINKAHNKKRQEKPVLQSFFDVMQKDPGFNLPLTKNINKILILNIYSIDLLEALKKIIGKTIESHEA